MRRILAFFLFVASTAAADAQKNRPAPPAGTIGGIKGTVIFEGEAPDRKKLLRDSDPYCAKTPRLSEDVVVTKGKLRDVLVRIKNGSGGTHTAPAQPAVI